VSDGKQARAWSPLLILLLPAMISGCVVGPPYVNPVVTLPAAYKEIPDGTDVLRPAQPNDAAPRHDWWAAFGDERLTALEAQLLLSNPSLAEAEARFRQARASVSQARAAYAPTVSASVSVDRSRGLPPSRSSVSAGPEPVTQYALNGGVSWEPDFWGRVRQTVAVGVASAQAAVGDLESARLSLAAELAQDYFQLRSLDSDLALLNETIEAYQRSLTLTQNQYNAGLVARADVAQAETLLESARAQAVDTRLQQAEEEHAIAVLVGSIPSSFALQALPLDGEPPQVPVELPSRLLERRPDIAAAERRVAAANAQIGMASSAFFPSVALTGSAGFQAGALGQLLTWPSGFWSLGPALAMTVFDGGARRAARAGAKAAYDEGVGGYRQVVLTAFQDVEDNLAAERLLAEESQRQRDATVAAQTALDVSLNQYRAGLVSYLPVATAQSMLLTSQRALVGLTARRFGAAVQLIRALGGGWEGRLDIADTVALGAT
jgi:NodT family efflux transporter outer membrane factor (OMF) lipoprotein